jgi:hypothetical protein
MARRVLLRLRCNRVVFNAEAHAHRYYSMIVDVSLQHSRVLSKQSKQSWGPFLQQCRVP